MNAKTERRASFTLIELLVVIAIIAILAALIIPALARAKALGYRISCTNNQKQLMLAFVMYEHDNNDFLPWPNWGSAAPNGWLYGSQGTVQSGALWRYLGNRNVYFCPVDLQRSKSSSKPPRSAQSYKDLFDARETNLGASFAMAL